MGEENEDGARGETSEETSAGDKEPAERMERNTNGESVARGKKNGS